MNVDQTNVHEVMDKIQKEADKHTDELRFVRTIAIDDVVRQGDIYITCTDLDPRGEEIAERQLAPGSTKGSRHVAHGDVKLYKVNNDVLTGPLIVARERFEVKHPEHSNISMPSGSYAVTYQRDLAAEERARVQD